MAELIEALGWGMLFMVLVCVNTVIADKIADILGKRKALARAKELNKEEKGWMRSIVW